MPQGAVTGTTQKASNTSGFVAMVHCGLDQQFSTTSTLIFLRPKQRIEFFYSHAVLAPQLGLSAQLGIFLVPCLIVFFLFLNVTTIVLLAAFYQTLAVLLVERSSLGLRQLGVLAVLFQILITEPFTIGYVPQLVALPLSCASSTSRIAVNTISPPPHDSKPFRFSLLCRLSRPRLQPVHSLQRIRAYLPRFVWTNPRF